MSDIARPAKRRKFDLSDEFKVEVGAGTTKKTYTVARDILVKSSDFLRAACNKNWKEGQTKTVKLPETKPDIFEIYLQLLYTGELVPMEENFPSTNAEAASSKDIIDRAHFAAIDTYLLADMLLDISSKNAVIDYYLAKIAGLGRWPNWSLVAPLCKATTAEAPMRRLMVNQVTWGLAIETTDASCQTYLQNYPQDFVIDVTLCFKHACLDFKHPEMPTFADRCTYHEHNDEFPKCK